MIFRAPVASSAVAFRRDVVGLAAMRGFGRRGWDSELEGSGYSDTCSLFFVNRMLVNGTVG